MAGFADALIFHDVYYVYKKIRRFFMAPSGHNTPRSGSLQIPPKVMPPGTHRRPTIHRLHNLDGLSAVYRETMKHLLFSLTLIGAVTLAACGKKEAPAEYLPRVFVQEVKPANYAAAVTLTGDVQARVQTDLSFRVGGKIISRSVDVGDHVKANQVLARLDPKDLQNNVDSAKAEVFAAQARVTQTSAAFVRQQKLLPKGYTRPSE